MNKVFGAFASAAMAGLIATAVKAEETKTPAEAYCQNNTCKGKSACKGHGNDSCKGQNSCKGQGWIKAKDQAACVKGKGTWMAAK